MKTIVLAFFASASLTAWGQSYKVAGTVLDAKSKVPVEFATLWIEGSGIGTMTDSQGKFVIQHLAEGKHEVLVRCLGYSEYKLQLDVRKDKENIVVYLSEQTLALNEVTVTAERKAIDATTAYTLGRTALDHLQSVSVSDALSLLPGEQTSKFKSLTSSAQVITLRGESTEMGNPDFGTVVEMDGVRLSGNATAASTSGTDTRNIGNSNVERIEVITGVPSVEYGDLTNGVVKIVTRKGKSPLIVDVAVPEGLPMSVTLSLALNMRRMLSTNNLVRKMHACETMGAITVICTDKTGTLTQNLMQVHEPNFYGIKNGSVLSDDDISTLIAEGISANSTAFLEESTTGEKPKGVGNPTEVALLLWLNKQGKNYLELREKAHILDQLTFSTERKFMATLVESPLIGKKILYIKGAPEIVLGKCKEVVLDGRRVDAVEYRSTVEAQLLGYQNMAMRTLGFAFKIVGENEPNDCTELVSANDLNFLGVVAISDPIRPDVPAAVAKCQSAGIGIKIVTGDTPGTATEIARQIGLWNPETDTERNRITGVAFAELSDEEALDRVMDLKIMSRARPTDKQRLVQLLQQKGAVVAVTGDGTNDAPALNHAQVGLSMGTGTSVAKEASDITLLDDSFNSIGTAVMWGRSLYKNIQRFIVFQLTINFVALLIVLLGSVIGTELPLTVTQMLWVNLIMDTFAALALASIPPSETVMLEKPRRSTDFIISKAMRSNILGVGSIFLIVLLGMIYYFDHSTEGMDIHNLTIFFTFFVMLQFWNLFNARVFGTTDSAFKGLSKSYGMELIVLAILAGQFLIVQFGGAVFRTEPLNWQTWLLIIGVSSTVLWEIFIRLSI